MLKKLLAVLVILATFGVFGYYLYNNPEQLRSLAGLSPLTLAGLTLGYSLMIGINALILHWSLHFVGYRIRLLENLLLTGYSTIVNFFGPLQSGPGVRAVYLKKRHGVKLRDFTVTLVVFYLFFAAINGTILLLALLSRLSSPLAYLLTILGVLVIGVLGYVLISKNAKFRRALDLIKLRDRNLWRIAFGAVASIAFTGFIYYVELSHVSDVSIVSALIYTAAANFSLFVALTPGAIGFREAFVLFTQQLHGIDTATILGANIIDRAFYIVFLLVLFIALLLVNARTRFRFSANTDDTSNAPMG